MPQGFQPIPVFSVPEDEDDLLKSFNSTVCPYNKMLESNNKHSKKYRDLEKSLEKAFSELSQIIGENIPLKSKNLHYLYHFFDMMEANRYDNIKNPEMSSELYKNLSFVYNSYLFITYFESPEQIRFSSSPLFKDILENFDNKIYNSSNKRMIFYSAHDTTLSVLMRAFNLTSFDCLYNNYLKNSDDSENCENVPGYASSLIIELHKNEDDYYVKLLYNGKYKAICGHSYECKYETFKNILLQYIVANWVKKCGHVPSNFNLYETESSGISFKFIILFIILVYIINRLMSPRKKKEKIKFSEKTEKID